MNAKKANDINTNSSELNTSKPVFNKINPDKNMSSEIELISCCDYIFLRINDESDDQLNFSITSHHKLKKYCLSNIAMT